MKKIPQSFFLREDVIKISRELLGKFLFTRFNEKLTGGMIVETEVYGGATDRASHAFNYRRTKRTEVFYSEGGIVYIYLCYGIHHLFNVITNRKNIPHAILIRAIEPVEGIDLMMKRRKKVNIDFSLTAGPGSLSEALGIKTTHTGISLQENKIWMEDHGIKISALNIVASPRVGVHYAKEDAKLPWRFRIRNNRWTSNAK